MKTVIAAMLVSAATASAQFLIDPAVLPLTEATGSWVGDVQTKPSFNGSVYQEIGGLGLATASGSAKSSPFNPMDFSVAQSHDGIVIRLKFATWDGTGFRLDLYDSEGDRSSSTSVVTFPQNGVWTGFGFGPNSFSGQADLTEITQWGISGLGSESAFHAAVGESATAPVPEPGVTAVVTGLALAGFALWKRRKDSAA